MFVVCAFGECRSVWLQGVAGASGELGPEPIPAETFVVSALTAHTEA
jgi:hypothetical protein